MDKTELTWFDYFTCGRTVSLRNIVLLEPCSLLRPLTNPETHREMKNTRVAVQTTKAYRVREVWFHSFLTLVLDDGKWSGVLVLLVVVVVTIMGQYY